MTIEHKLSALAQIVDRLQHSGVEFTLGGSCLLYAHDLVTDFNDIDFLSEEKEDRMLVALKGIELRKQRPSGIYFSDYFYKFTFMGVDFDLMGNFHIQGFQGRSKIHSLPSGMWNGIPLGSLTQWKKAYELMIRPDRAALIQTPSP